MRKLNGRNFCHSGDCSLQWGRNFIVAEMLRIFLGFCRQNQLQWGRNFIVAEIERCCDSNHYAPLASMGPQLYRCGNLIGGMIRSNRFVCFNGAATLSLRKFSKSETSFTVGINSFNGAATLSLRKFQGSKKVPSRTRNASMGPQLYRCGNLQLSKKSKHISRGASMGPQLYRCGNHCVCECVIRAKKLQWGRNFIVAEIRPPLVGSLPFLPLLQWGRNFIVAEMEAARYDSRKILESFNGAATLSLRKWLVTGTVHSVIGVLQWGRNFIVAEMH